MAVDSVQKRFAIARNVFPVAAKDGPWRITVARSYPVATLPLPSGFPPLRGLNAGILELNGGLQ